jgi:hypothetical protein
MPHPALIPLAAAVATGVFQSRSNNKAIRASSQAGADALAFSREQEATRQRERAEQMAMERAQWDAREQRRGEILARYGRRYTPRPYSGAPQGSSSSTFGQMFGAPTMRRPTTLGGMYGG